jgi:hypothetical protein
MKPKHWKSGVADEVWKVMIAARDAQRAKDMIGYLCYALTDAGNDATSGIAKIRQMTGDDIMTALLQMHEKSAKAVGPGSPSALPRNVNSQLRLC